MTVAGPAAIVSMKMIQVSEPASMEQEIQIRFMELDVDPGHDA